MTEPDNTPEFDPATDADAPVEETTPSETPVEETAPEAPVEETAPSEAPVEESAPEAPVEENASETVVSPEPVEVSPEVQAEQDFNSPEVDSQPVSGVPTPGAVSDNYVQPELDDVPENSKAEPRNAETTHQATAEQVDEGQE